MSPRLFESAEKFGERLAEASIDDFPALEAIAQHVASAFSVRYVSPACRNPVTNLIVIPRLSECLVHLEPNLQAPVTLNTSHIRAQLLLPPMSMNEPHMV